MSIKLKSQKEIEIMNAGGSILHDILVELQSVVAPGISTLELDILAEELCVKKNVKPAFKGYGGYKATICCGIDDVAVHGIPSREEKIKDGQIVSIDMGIIYKDFYLDSAVTVGVGEVDDMGQKLMDTTKLALESAIKVAIDGNTVGDIGYVIEQVANIAGFSVITQMTGHGVGRNLHEDPQIPCFGERGKGEKLKKGMVIAIEPMLNEGESELVFDNDGWTTRTIDGKRSAIFEHTVAIGSKSAIILTK